MNTTSVAWMRVGALVAMTGAAVDCSSSSLASPDGGSAADTASDPMVNPDDAGGDSAPPAQSIFGRFGNFDVNFPPFDVCRRTISRTSGATVHPTPLLSAIPELAGGVPFDRVTRRLEIPFIPSSQAVTEMFLVRGDTTDCAAPTELLGGMLVFAQFAGAAGERNTFVALDPSLLNLVRERVSCPASTACLHFFNFSTPLDGSGIGPPLDVDIVDAGARTPLLRDIGTGNDGPAEAPFVFDRDTGTLEIPVSGRSLLTLAVSESATATPVAEVELPDPAGQLFSLWIVGRSDGTGPSARRAILCRDFAPDNGDFSDCSRIGP
jgi:hypothetical protein